MHFDSYDTSVIYYLAQYPKEGLEPFVDCMTNPMAIAIAKELVGIDSGESYAKEIAPVIKVAVNKP